MPLSHSPTAARPGSAGTKLSRTTFSFAGGNWGWVAPFEKTREARFRLRLALCKAAIAGVNAIRAIVPRARMVHVNPLVQAVAPRDRSDLTEATRHETY